MHDERVALGVYGREVPRSRVTGSAENDNPHNPHNQRQLVARAGGPTRPCGNARATQFMRIRRYTARYVRQCISTYLYARVHSIH